jgi:2-isopropylmalate synthase
VADHSELIYDWNKVYEKSQIPKTRVFLDDESLRDGLQSPSVRDPSIAEKIEILHLMEDLGIDMLDVGLPGAGPRPFEHSLALVKEIAAQKMRIRPNAAVRTHETDIRALSEVQQQSGYPVEAAMFIGSSPIRRYTENWTDDFLLQTTEKSIKLARSLDIEVMYVTEDTTRCDPETVKRLYTAAIECGARAITLTDTTGHATPMGTLALTKFVIENVIKPSGRQVRLDWHGHCDRGLAVANSIAAVVAGANCVHGTATGIGERVGNTQMDLMLVNLKLMGVEPWVNQDLTKLKAYCDAVSLATDVKIPCNYPVVGSDAFRTATGVHAAALIKAFRKNDEILANTVYSGVPSHYFGMEQKIDIGPMSGKSNVVFWLERHGFEPEEELVDIIFQKAKRSDRCLGDAEIMDCCTCYAQQKGCFPTAKSGVVIKSTPS